MTPEHPQASSIPSSPPAPSLGSIVVVDDDPHLLAAIEALLTEEGYTIEGFTDPADALDRLRSGPRPDLVLCDCVMPRLSGGEVVDALARAGVDAPVVLMTALSDPSFCVARGKARVLSKPFQLEDLRAEIDAALAPRPRIVAA